MVNEHVFIFRSNSKISQNFLYYLTSNLFQSQVKDLAYRKKAQPGLSSEHLKKIKLPMVEPEFQNEIISKIQPIENKINELKLKSYGLKEL